MASSAHDQPIMYGGTVAPPPTPSTQSNSLSTSATADTLSRLLLRLPPTLSLPIRRPPSLPSASLPFISFSDFQLGYFQLTNHSLPSQLAHSAESESVSLFNISRDQKEFYFPKNWLLDFDSKSLCFNFPSSTELSESPAELPLPFLRKFARAMEEIGLEIVECFSSVLGFENPLKDDPTRFCSFLWISSGSGGDKPYPYVVRLQYQIRCQKYSLMTDSGSVSVSPQVDSVLVTLGDIAQVWSNGKLKKVRGTAMACCEESENSNCITTAVLITLPLHSEIYPLHAPNCDEEEGDESDENCVKFSSFSIEEYVRRVSH